MSTPLTLKQILKFAAEIEEGAAGFYDTMAKTFAEDPDVGTVFDKLAADEKSHHRKFEDFGASFADVDAQAKTEDDANFLRAMAHSGALDPETGAFKDADQITNTSDALHRAFEFEKATLSYYQAVREVFGENPELNAMIDMEKSHVTTLMKILISQGLFRGLG